MYKRVFVRSQNLGLHAACMDYYKCCSEFSDDAMHLNDLEEAVKGKV